MGPCDGQISIIHNNFMTLLNKPSATQDARTNMFINATRGNTNGLKQLVIVCQNRITTSTIGTSVQTSEI